MRKRISAIQRFFIISSYVSVLRLRFTLKRKQFAEITQIFPKKRKYMLYNANPCEKKQTFAKKRKHLRKKQSVALQRKYLRNKLRCDANLFEIKHTFSI